ncbi:MAG: ABC transporter transmembrane domain-containing protein, partial [Candidatus Puniceispirillaceae bacterium]
MWPASNFDLRARVVLALLALVATKFVAILSPILQAWAVDDLAGSGVPEFALGAIGLTVAYGMARIATNGFQQVRDALFAKVAQSALRRLALETFEHIHRLSMRYHITRKTGGLSRIIERGVKGVEFLLRYLVFSTGPLVLELVLIGAAIFWKLQDWRYVGIILATIAVYVWFTFAITEWRVKLRRKMNEQDTDANQKAIDSLLNFETVKYFGAAGREAARYDEAMAGYEAAALKTSYSLAFLNFG